MDYELIGLKSGLELHQQLNTNKLFCRCPSIIRRDNSDFTVMRKLHPVAGETGEVDEAVKFESIRNREFIYEFYNDTNCLLELDESPPEEIDQEALKTALQISLLLNCEIIQDTQIMRKTVIDGSNTSGFQRTVLIARKGWLDTAYGKVRIDAIALEEDSARIISQEKNKAVFRLDRLGIPLVEIATAPDIKTPEQAKEVALFIGDILRACNVKRGLGTIRQDVNMSIKSGERIEIKGVQDPELIKKTIEAEILRQEKLIKKKESRPEVRKAHENGSTSFLRPLPGAARMYPETDHPLLHISKNMIDEAKKSLPKLRSEIKSELETAGLNKEMVALVVKNNKVEDFQELHNITKNANLIAKTLVLWQREIASHEKIKQKKVEQKLTLDILEDILREYEKKKLSEGEIKKVMIDIIKGISLKDALRKEEADLGDIECQILKIIKQKPGLSEKAYMGLIMKEFKGKISGKEAMEIIEKLMK